MKILVVESQQQNSQVVTSALKSQYFEVDCVETPQKGTECALVNEYDVLVISNDLPCSQDDNICKAIRNLNNHAPIIILSEKSDLQTKIQFFNDGADDYLLKPFAPEELVARVRALMRRPKQIEPETLSLDKITINLTSHTVFKNKKPISLTRKEFMLLAYLMKNQDLVISRAQIMEHVWQMETDPFSNTIETHILSLRKKLGDRENPKNIQTISGVGYKITNKANSLWQTQSSPSRPHTPKRR